MATRYWVGGSGRWNNVTTTNWSTISGGGGGASPPTDIDDAIFNSLSSGASYIVDVESGNVCKSITTTAPAVGTLTFNPMFGTMNVLNGDINIHAACLYSGTININHAPTVAGTYTTTFNSPGTNTQLVTYTFTQASASTTLNFCNSNTATFAQVNISVGGTFISTNAVLTNEFTILSPLSCTFGGGATSVTMTGTTLNMTGSTTQILTIGGSTTTTWAISTLAVNMTNFRIEFPTGNILSIGRDSATQPTAMGAVTFTNCVGNAWFARASTLTLTHPLSYNTIITLATALTTSGALTLSTDSVLNNPSFAVSIGGTTTLTGDASIFSTSNSASTTFTGAVTIANKGINPSTFYIAANTTTALGTFVFSNGVTLTPTGTNSNYLLANIISADAITATNTFINATTSLTVNGGVGKAFSYTVTTSAIPVKIIRQTVVPYEFPFASGIYEYPCIAATSASITTPTTSFVGTNLRRVVYGQPRSSTKIANDTLTISGSTPTLTNVTFLGTSINAGATNYTGTRLGTDGLSNGFLPATGVQKFVVTAVNAAFDTAIWALTSGGATSMDNYPLPQDTIIYDSGASGSTISYVGQLHIGTVNMTANFGQLLYSYGESAVYCYGDISMAGTNPAFCQNMLQLTQSGNLNRSVTVLGAGPTIMNGGGYSMLTFDAGNTTNFVFSGVVSRRVGNLYVLSGNNEYLEGSTLGTDISYTENMYFLGGTHTMRTTQFYTNTFNISNGVVFPSSNYTVFFHSVSAANTCSYVNSATTTALNGSIELPINSNYLMTIVGTTATNPLKNLKLINTYISSGSLYAPTLSLPTENIYLEGLTTGVNLGWNISGGGGVRGLVKTNGGTVSLTPIFVNNVTASPLNTFYVTGTSTLTGTTTGWTYGAAPASPPSGGFLFF